MVAKSAVEERPSPPSTLLGQEALLESLRTTNLEFLSLMSQLAQASSYYSLDVLGNLSPLFRELTPESAAQASRFPFLLVDLHFTEASWWRSGAQRQRLSVRDACGIPKDLSAAATSVAHSALILAWHAVRTERDASFVLMGLSGATADALTSMTLRELQSVALQDSTSIQPRWSNSPALWTQLLLRPHTSHMNIAREFVVHALQLTASAHLR
jgi:hypothetical protein